MSWPKSLCRAALRREEGVSYSNTLDFVHDTSVKGDCLISFFPFFYFLFLSLGLSDSLSSCRNSVKHSTPNYFPFLQCSSSPPYRAHAFLISVGLLVFVLFHSFNAP